MKQKLKIMMLAIAAMAICIGQASAQDQQKRQRLSREEFATKQAQHIASQLALDEAKTKQFVAVYTQCQKEIWALHRGDRPRKASGEAQSEAQIENNIKQRFEHSQKILDIRQKYYKEYSRFLTQAQIQRVYEIEKQTMSRLKKKGRPDGRKHNVRQQNGN